MSSGTQQPWRRMSVRLAAGGFLSLILLCAILTSRGKYDKDWHKSVGIPDSNARHVPFQSTKDDIRMDGNVLHADNRQLQQHPDGIQAVDEALQRTSDLRVGDGESGVKLNGKNGGSGSEKTFFFRNGKEFFADYNVWNISLQSGNVPEGQQPKFKYIDPKTSPWTSFYVSNEPRVLVVPEFLTDEECDLIVSEAKRKLFRSQVSPFLSSKDRNTVNDVRTSSQAWLSATANPAKPVVERVLEITGFPKGAHEELQVLRYELGQKYDAHNDYFDPKLYGAQRSNRAVTVFLYLADTEEGGETWFPRADGKPPTYDFKSCVQGLRVRPKKRSIVIFYDMRPDGSFDDYSLHGGCPVKKGIKWGGTLWLRVDTP